MLLKKNIGSVFSVKNVFERKLRMCLVMILENIFNFLKIWIIKKFKCYKI